MEHRYIFRETSKGLMLTASNSLARCCMHACRNGKTKYVKTSISTFHMWQFHVWLYKIQMLLELACYEW
jgi:hypothetical protein